MQNKKPIQLNWLSNLLATFIFFSPNFLYYFKAFQGIAWLFFIYNFVIMLILLSTISHMKYK